MEVGASVGASPVRVFISYSRSDGTRFAHELRDKLKQYNCEVWLDTDQIRGGDRWTAKLEAALNGCDVLLAVLTEGSYKSGICRAEQLWALDHEKRVIPVFNAPGIPRPIHLYGLNYRHLPEDEHDLLADLNAAPNTAPAPDRPAAQQHYETVPEPPLNFVPREDVVAKLQELVFSEDEQRPAAVTAVAGMGGIGKSVLAASLCRNPAVRRAFPDGIAWITVGREWNGDSAAAMRHLATALGANLSGEASPLACQNRYRELVRGQAALTVIDDVWDLTHLQPLLLPAPRSRFLFTTRDRGIAKAAAARQYEAHLLGREEGRRLLAQSAGIEVGRLPNEADEIVQTCDGLALAIVQIGGTLRDVSLPEWRDTLEALQRADIRAIEKLLPPGQQSFFKSLGVSIDAIPFEMQERYYKLAVLLEDVPDPLGILQEGEARRTARYFVDRSLATWDSAAEPRGGIKLHDLQLDYVRACYPNRHSLNLIRDAIRLSSHVIQTDPRQFASQVTGRLLLHCDSPWIKTFLDEISRGATKPWVRPIRAGLHPPGTKLVRTLVGVWGAMEQ